MKKVVNFISVILFMSIIFLSTSSSTFAANWKDVTFVNHTGKTIYKLYFTGSGNSNWGKNYLDSSILESGESKTLRYNADIGLFDFRVDFDTNAQDWYHWRQFNFSGVWRITIYPNGEGGYRAVKN